MLTQALIPAAGRGIRAFPKTQYVPKPLLEIDGNRPLREDTRNQKRLLNADLVKVSPWGSVYPEREESVVLERQEDQ